jgi:hypothetical protein
MEGPEPSKQSGGDKLWRTAEARGRDVAGWAGRGHEERGFSTLALAAGALYLVSLLLPWIHSFSAWTGGLATLSGPTALAVAWLGLAGAVVLVALAALRLGTLWGSAQ